MNKLKLFEFKFNGYGAFDFTIVAETKEEAIEIAEANRSKLLCNDLDFKKSYKIDSYNLSKGLKTTEYIE